jgi:hypothetical protein
MGWPAFLVIMAVALGVPYALFVFPLSRAVLRAILIARDPIHRSTPESPWELFDRVVWRRLTPAWLLWAVMLFGACLVGPMMYVFLGPLSDAYPLIFFYALLYPAHLAGSWAMAFAGLMFWAPRSGSAGLLAKITASVIAGQAMVGMAAWALMVRTAGLTLPGRELGASFAIATLVVGLSAAALSWMRARGRGDAWFEFDEDRLERSGRIPRR